MGTGRFSGSIIMMDKKHVRATIMGAASAILAVGVLLLQLLRERESASTGTLSQKSSRKRKLIDLKFDEMAEQLGNIAAAIKSLSTGGIDENELYQQVMTIGDDFHEEDLGKAFEFLMTNEVQAKIFKAKSTSLKRKWIKSFISSLG